VLTGLKSRLRLARLGLVTDRAGEADWADFCRAVFRAGVDLLLIDQSDLDRSKLSQAVQQAARAGLGRGRIVGLRQGDPTEGPADLVHLSRRGPTPDSAPGQPWLGLSAEAPDELEAALADPRAAYVTVGPWRGPGPGDDGSGPDLSRLAARLAPPADPASPPWFATGGVSWDDREAIWAAGARRVILRRDVLRAPDPVARAAAWADWLRQAWRADQTLSDYRRAVRWAEGSGR
jgi:thiamine monophosphate synthase